MEYQKYLPAIVIVGIAAIAIKKLSGGSTQIINRGVDFTHNESVSVNRDPARVSAFDTLAKVALGEQSITSKRDTTLAQIEAERIRASSALDTLKYRTDAEVEIARINAASRAYDRDSQQRAIDRANDYAAAAARRQTNNNLLNSILGALSSLAKSAQTPRSGTGSTSGQTVPARRIPRPTTPNITFRTPPFTPEYPIFNPSMDFGLPDSGSGFDLLPRDNTGYLDLFNPWFYNPGDLSPDNPNTDLFIPGASDFTDPFGIFPGFDYDPFGYTNPFSGGFGYDPTDFGNPLGGLYDDTYDFYGFDFD